jgi:nucleoside-diphosphate-sugar epimerase
METEQRRVLVTGGAGYVGSTLCPKLLDAGYAVTVLDTFWYGEGAIAGFQSHPKLTIVRGDVRELSAVRASLSSVTDVVHLACISNDPSYDLEPELGKSINLDSFLPLVRESTEAGVTRFIYASSSSVYGVKDEEQVTEELTLEPLTDYSRYKAECEAIVLEAESPSFTTSVVRPATVCGPSPRQRLDLTVNILTSHAVHRGEIIVHGGDQFRPNVHINDMCAVYLDLLAQPKEKIGGETFNVGSENMKVSEIASLVRRTVGGNVSVSTQPSSDNRSYRISSEKIRRDLGFTPRFTVEDAVRGLMDSFGSGVLTNPLENPAYFNLLRMKEVLADGSA